MSFSTVSSTVTITTTVPAINKRSTVVAGREVGEIHGFHDLNGNLAAAPLQQRQATESPSSIPSYASACSSLAAYSSACSCIGVSHVTVTAAGVTASTVFTMTETVTSPSLPTKVVDVTTGVNSTTATNTSSRPTLTSNSTAIYANTTIPTSSPTRILDTSCGETATPFHLQVSQPSGPFDNWYAHLSGDSILFTSEQSTATSFSVEGSKHLCAIGYEGELGNPIIAVIGNVTDSGAVWLLDGKVAEALESDYVPVECEVGGGGLKCVAQDRGNWLGCGLQLDLGKDAGTVDGIECTGIELRVV
jgi:hypothetical protein